MFVVWGACLCTFIGSCGHDGSRQLNAVVYQKTPSESIRGEKHQNRLTGVKLNEMQPIAEEEFQSLREQCNTTHHGVPKGRTECNHEEPNTNAGGLAD